MSAWRREALERFPERKRELQAASSVYEFLGQLEHDLRAVYRGARSEPDLADRIFDFAAWCFDDRQNWDLRNAVAVGFYEHLPNVPEGRHDMARRLAFERLQELHPLFVQMLGPSDYEALMVEITRVHGRRLPPPVPPAT